MKKIPVSGKQCVWSPSLIKKSVLSGTGIVFISFRKQNGTWIQWTGKPTRLRGRKLVFSDKHSITITRKEHGFFRRSFLFSNLYSLAVPVFILQYIISNAMVPGRI